MIRRLALALIWICACTVQLGAGERRITAGELTNEVIVPTLDDVVARAGELTVTTRALADAPDAAKLDAAQAAWRAARIPWKETDAYRFGPAKYLGLTAAIDQPIDPARIDVEIAATTPVTDQYVETLGANKKGFHAIEYLIFRADALASFTAEPRRLELLVAFTANLETKARQLRDAWTGGYAITLAKPGETNMDYPTIKSVIDALTNESVAQSELLADTRIGKPMGTGTGGVPQPDLEESGPSDNSLPDLAASLRGIRNIYFGSRTGDAGKGIGKLVAAQSPAVDRDVRDALATAIAAVEAIPRPYRDALVAQSPEVAAAHDAVKELKTILATEVVGVLGATLKFNDNDGD